VTFTCPSQRQLKEVRPDVLDRAIVLQDRDRDAFVQSSTSRLLARDGAHQSKASGDDFQQCKTVT
jgi:hypothetical protein